MTACNHERKGVVISGAGEGRCSHAPVCERPECVAEALAWAAHWTGLPARHLLDAQKTEVSA
jgi:hypothetical protein